jgi:hypothetical protein
MSNLPWSAQADSRAIAEILRLGEVKLEDMLTTALASDARAINQASILAALAGGLLAAGIAITQVHGYHQEYVVGPIVSAVVTLIGSFVSRQAAAPVDFAARGYSPHNLAPLASDFDRLMMKVAEKMDKRIIENTAHMEKAAKLLTWGFRIAVLGLVLGALTAIIGP